MGAAIAAIVVAGTLAILVLVMISAKVGYFIIAVLAILALVIVAVFLGMS